MVSFYLPTKLQFGPNGNPCKKNCKKKTNGSTFGQVRIYFIFRLVVEQWRRNVFEFIFIKSLENNTYCSKSILVDTLVHVSWNIKWVSKSANKIKLAFLVFFAIFIWSRYPSPTSHHILIGICIQGYLFYFAFSRAFGKNRAKTNFYTYY